MEGNRPEISEGQKIGRVAQRALQASMPNDWSLTDLAGTEDFGYDYQVQTTPGDRAEHIFRVQLKGTMSPDLNATGEYFSIQIKASTLRYYARATEPVMLVLCDVSVNPERPALCPLYYVWLHEEIRRIESAGGVADRQNVTVRVPKANELDNDTDLSEEIERFGRLASVGDALDLIAGALAPDIDPLTRAADIQRIPAGFAARSSAFFDAMVEAPVTPWPVARSGTLAWLLVEAAQSAGSGSIEKTDSILDAAQARLEEAKPLERAEYWFLRGKMLNFCGDDSGARDAYAEAAASSADAPKYLAAWAETELRFQFSPEIEQADFDAIVRRLAKTDDPRVMGVKARALGASRRFDEALEVTAAIEGVERYVSAAMIHSMLTEWGEVVTACEQGLALENVSSNSKLLLHMLKARARFNLAVDTEGAANADGYLPVTGAAGSDIGMAQAAWRDMKECMEMLGAAGWPPNTQFVADIYAATASMLGLQREALDTLRAAGATRPHFKAIQEALESVAVQLSEFSIALDANARQGDDEVTVYRRLMLLHADKRNRDSVELMQSALPRLSKTHTMFGNAILSAALAADRIVRPDLIAEWAAIMDSEPSLAPFRALLDYHLALNRNRLGAPGAAQRLNERYEALGRPIEIAVQLFHAQETDDPEQARRCVELAERLEQTQLMHMDGALHLSQALITLRRWHELLDLATGSLRRFESSKRLAATEALALDRLGRTAEALDALKALVSDGAGADSVALQAYVNIVARCGFISEAIESVEILVSAARSAEKQIDALKLLFNLIHLSDPLSGRLAEVAWRVGDLANVENERQEGAFLALFLTAIQFGSVMHDDARLPAFYARAQAFSARFPRSQLFTMADLPENASGEEVLSVIESIFGSDAGSQRARLRIENQLHRGDAPFPFAWRPRNVLSRVGDIATLWEIAKRSKHHEKGYHLTIAMDDWSPAPLDQLRERVPLIDITALLVAQDLGLIDLIFEIFPMIAVGQTTMYGLTNTALPITASPFREKYLAIQTSLRARLDRIIQPFAGEADEQDFIRGQWGSGEMVALLASGNYALYSDDALNRIYCAGAIPGLQGFCVLDVLYALEEMGRLTTPEVASKIALLCSWRVGLMVDLKYQRACVPDKVAAAKSLEEACRAMAESKLAVRLFDAIWDIDTPYEKFRDMGASLLRELALDDSMTAEGAGAVMTLWYGKAKLRREAPRPVLRAAALLALQAAFFDEPLTDGQTRKLWGVYHALTLIEHGDRMDRQKELDAIATLGKVAADIDHEWSGKRADSVRERMARGVTADTADADAFNAAYTKGRMHAIQTARDKSGRKS